MSKTIQLTPEETKQLGEQSKIAAWMKFLGQTAKNNTVHIHKGQIFARQMEDLAAIVERSRVNYVSSVFDKYNIEQAKVNVETGELIDIVFKKKDV